MRGWAALVAAILGGLPSIALAETLSLQCSGYVEDMVETGTTSGAAVDNHGNTVGAATVQSGRVRREMVVDFEMTDQEARLRVPKEMQPGLGGGKNGWFKVANLQVSDRLITGDVKMNFLYKSRFEIDRATGVMVTKSGFRADCVPVDATKRKF